jgi:hypothetical protein
MDRKPLVLATIESTLMLQTRADLLSAEQVNELGRQLGLTDRDTFELVRQLSVDDKINLEWGGKVKKAMPKQELHPIHLEQGATYVGPGAQINQSAVGSNASVAISGLSEKNLTEIIAALTSTNVKLSAISDGVPAEFREEFQKLTDAVKQIQQQLLSSEKPEKETLGKRLDEAGKALSVLEKAGNLGMMAAAHLPQIWETLHHAFQTLGNYIGGS